ncbi:MULTISPECIES: helix-turn-helix domain-containing protein [unclassified Tatumella]|uniref:helix-turn-helix domain-containing protein n=1 Tax=unclassified Tatumella TaxID=2649542 RepID=UPI001BAFC675|nr:MULTISPECIES: helix-turn-helix domain-containing protein [unclassified Tatumella]MBS0877569.1 helix-turn-helix domain-containing protein [Tatumella sp. JGM82]MBS0891078.1 helix-turn-helix domain-containing protein [Tatumella sp. JGM94]MBS0902101.1 helix-turn-helix domain-containing protein [Tatumella sp. JGM100]
MNSFTQDLVDWIEKHLEGKLTIDDVAAKAGYSKWHLQRMFREDTGFQLASYIRYRKLHKAALILKMTAMPAVEISDLLGFSSQQTFTRAFTRHFGIAPGKYRATHDWHFRGMVGKATHDLLPVPEPEIVTQGPEFIHGTGLSYYCDHNELEDIDYHCRQRLQIIQQVLSMQKGLLHSCVAEDFEPDPRSGKIRFTLTFKQSLQDHELRQDRAGSFLRFRFSGTQQQFVDMQASIYQNVMPFRPEARRAGQDVFISQQNCPPDQPLPDTFSGCYYIPVSAVIPPAGENYR